jgi:hypothetical protein
MRRPRCRPPSPPRTTPLRSRGRPSGQPGVTMSSLTHRRAICTFATHDRAHGRHSGSERGRRAGDGAVLARFEDLSGGIYRLAGAYRGGGAVTSTVYARV